MVSLQEAVRDRAERWREDRVPPQGIHSDGVRGGVSGCPRDASIPGALRSREGAPEPNSAGPSPVSSVLRKP